MAKERKSHGKPIRYELKENPTKGDTILETADLVVTSVATAASMSPIPLVGEAAGLVLEILTIIQDVQDNKDQFKQLASHAYQLVARAVSACSPYGSQRDLPSPLRTDLDTLIHALKPVRDYSAKKLQRGWIKRVIFRRHDEQVIRNYYNEVKNGLELFNMSSHIELRQGQAEIIKRLDAQAQASSKANSEISLQSPHSPYPPSSVTNTANAYSSPYDSPFGPGFPFNQVSSPHYPPSPPPQPMFNHGDSYNSGNVVVTNVMNSNNDYSNNVHHHYSQDYPRPRRGPAWKQYR
ncbi:hypothetical protein EST38_g8220 [Candolleomyces aberdarensis]|uniref:Uncharacterized protein n=1 Tax=Candolleomyces aberdarensis TaxID=2316362 RepID=A0A4Q2DFD1_9AGAR|nr:hypothetical protein EST38_g8220 [Candolleomyces aberdarensis]